MKATFGGGCFWCTEVIFQNTEGITSVKPGYMGGELENPAYKQVYTGETGHVEVVELEFDEHKVSFKDLLAVFFKTHDPTTWNRQGEDVGTHYRSVIFYHNDEQKSLSEEMINALTEAEVFEDAIVTAVEPAKIFWPAEDYHIDYFNRNPENPFCAAVIAPKLTKFLKSIK